MGVSSKDTVLAVGINFKCYRYSTMFAIVQKHKNHLKNSMKIIFFTL